MGTPRDFDFWVGEWDVFGPRGRQVGTNSIVSLYDGGALAEHWHGNGGVEGHSLNAYDAHLDRWHQTWVDSTGGLLLLTGAFVDGSMVLSGTTYAEGGEPEQQQISWTRQDDGVRQHWQVSTDGGTSWTTAFDGHYRRRGA